LATLLNTIDARDRRAVSKIVKGKYMNKSLTINYKVIEERKVKAKSTLIINLLKKFDIPGSQAVRMYHQNGPEYLVRKCFLLEYHLYKKKPVLDRKRWLMAAINNDWNESEEFNNWYKHRKDDIVNNGNDDMKQLLSI